MSDLSSFLSTRNKSGWSAKLWDGLIEAIGARLAPLEEQLNIQREVADAIIARGLTVIEQELAPIVAQADQILDESTAEITAKLERFEAKVTGGTVLTSSTTSVSLSNGATVNMTIVQADREFFAPTPYIALSRASTTANWAIGKVNSLNRSTGVLALTLEQVTGPGGPYTDWIITSLPAATLFQKSIYEQTLALRQQVADDKAATSQDRADAQAARLGAEGAATASADARDGSQAAYADLRKAVAEPIVPPNDPHIGQLWWDGTIVRVYDGVGFVPTVTASIGGLRFDEGVFGVDPDGVITIGGGFNFVMVWLNGVLLYESRGDFISASPTITIDRATEGDEWKYWAYQAIDATDYDTKEQVNDKIDAALTGKSIRVDTNQGHTAAEMGQARANIGAGILAGFRNKILNGLAEVTQRGTTFNIPAGQAAYTADRIRIVNNTNQTLNVQCPVVIPFAGSGKHPRLRLSFATAPTTGNVFITQRIEGADTLAGRKVTMSFAHAVGEVITGSCYLGQNFGTSGSAGVSTSTQTVLLRNDGGIGIAKLAFDLPSTEGKIFGSSDFLEWVVSLPVRTTQPLTITRMSLVEGDATSEDDPYSPRHIRQETELVERYYREVVFRTTTSATAASQYFNLNLDQRGMRANPSVSSKGSVELINAGNFAAVSSVQVTWQALAAGPVVAGGVLVLDAEL